MESVVRYQKRIFLSVAVITLFLTAPLEAQRIRWTNRISAERGRPYRLTKQHGPWMIMVASFSEPPNPTEGLSPQEAADELVYELRKKSIPAYTYEQQNEVERIQTFDRLGRKTNRRYTSQRGSICVVAGNYQSIDENTREGKTAQATLEIVQAYHPKFLGDVEASSKGVFKLANGGIYRRTPGQAGPLGGAFLTINPLLSPEEVRKAKRDPLLRTLNSDSEYSLIRNPGKYTLVVASFYGSSVTKVGDSGFKQALEKFKIDNTLDRAAHSAWELTQAMRQAKSIGYDRDFEAWVYHDRHKSVVTVGSFDRPDDPQIRQMYDLFAAKLKPHGSGGQNVLLGEFFTVPRQPRPGKSFEKRWIFDPEPRLMEVPEL